MKRTDWTFAEVEAILRAVEMLDTIDVRNLLIASDLVIEEDFGERLEASTTSDITITFDIFKFRTKLKELLV